MFFTKILAPIIKPQFILIFIFTLQINTYVQYL